MVVIFVTLQVVLYYQMKRSIQSQMKLAINSSGSAISSGAESGLVKGRFESLPKKVNATFIILARNSDIDGLKESIGMLESTFNKRFGYPYVFLNDVEFTSEFMEEMKKLSSSEMKFGKVPKEHWSFPTWIDTEKAAKVRTQMKQDQVIYGDSESYRHMCRFNSGFFFRHPLLETFEYYWRVEPNVKFFCNLVNDPFEIMKKNDYYYGWVISLPEYPQTIATLWNTTLQFIKDNPGIITKENTMQSLIDNFDGQYNLCHYWSNFEIGNLNFFRSEKYLKYFDYLDKAGGFFYERWGDAPVHSIAVSMFLPRSKIHYFDDIGYYHGPFTNCPVDPLMANKCTCDPKDTISHDDHCFKKFNELI